MFVTDKILIFMVLNLLQGGNLIQTTKRFSKCERDSNNNTALAKYR